MHRKRQLSEKARSYFNFRIRDFGLSWATRLDGSEQVNEISVLRGRRRDAHTSFNLAVVKVAALLPSECLN